MNVNSGSGSHTLDDKWLFCFKKKSLLVKVSEVIFLHVIYSYQIPAYSCFYSCVIKHFCLFL